MGKPTKKQTGITFGYCDEKTGQRVYPPPQMTDIPELLPEQLPPAQASRKTPEKGDMFANLTSWPPLGQVTVVPKSENKVKFTVLLETNRAVSTSGDVQVCLWHGHIGSDWSELSFKEDQSLDKIISFNSAAPTVKRWYTAELARSPDSQKPVSFTVKFRVGKDTAWKWMNDQTSVSDGTVIFQQDGLLDHDLSYFFDNISSDIAISRETPDTPDTTLFSLTAPVKPAKGEDSGYTEHCLGTPSSFSRWFALVRLWSPWLAPRQGSGKFDADKDAVLASFMRNDGLHVVCLGISGVEDVLTVLKHDGHGNVIVQGRNDLETAGTSRILVAVAESFEVANAAVMYQARKVIANNPATSEAVQEEEAKAMDDNVKPEWLEEWYDGLTYCTWNALGQNLTEDKIFDALDILKKENIIISNLIIDDNWQSITEGASQMDRSWLEFEANKEGFPRGLRQAVINIRKKHPNVNHIAVWHAILGYWGGISPHGKIAKDYKTLTVQKEAGVAQGAFTVVDASEAPRMYDDFYRFLSSCGIDSVKTDAQFFLDMLEHAPARRAMSTTYQDAWTVAHLRYFSSRAISCMSQTPPILFHSQLPRNKPTLLVRNSDDFFPEVPASHPWHIFCNAHNSILTQHLNVLPDWDMFQTNHEWAGFHAAGRCVSGGPIYFTDYPGKHDFGLIKAMTAKTLRGRNVILRPHRVGRSIDAYAGYEDQRLLKVGTYVGFAKTGTGILGIFNCFSSPLAEFVKLQDFPGVQEDIRYVVRSFDGMVSRPMHLGDDHAMVKVDLDVRGWSILSAHPLREFVMKKGEETREVTGEKSGIYRAGRGYDDVGANTAVALLGLVGKMTGPAGVVNHNIYVEDNGRLRVWTSFKALGVMGLWISSLPSKTVDADVMVLLCGKVVPRECVSVTTGGEVLEVDVERAWNELGEKVGWSNEVSVEVFVS